LINWIWFSEDANQEHRDIVKLDQGEFKVGVLESSVKETVGSRTEEVALSRS